MRWRGVLSVFLLLMLLLNVSVSAQFPSHENFDVANEDFFALTSFLQDSIKFCEQVVNVSYAAQATAVFSPTVNVTFDEKEQQESLTLSDHLGQHLNYSSMVLDAIDESVQSRSMLQDVLIPLRSMSLNVTRLARNHSFVLDFFESMQLFISTGEIGNSSLISNMTQVHQQLTQMSDQIRIIQDQIPLLQSYFSMNSLEQDMHDFSKVVNRYERYLDLFVSFLYIDEPYVALYTDKNECYLSENLTFHGYFIEPTGFVSNQSISLYKDDDLLYSTETNRFGRFTFFVDTVNETTDTYSFQAETSYENNLYRSDPVVVSFSLMPTNITLVLSKTQLQPNESVTLTGRLRTITQKPLQEHIHLVINDQSFSVQTDESGSFSYVFSNYSIYGSYTVTGSFQPTKTFEPCSDTLVFSINEPTLLSLISNQNTFTDEDTIKLHGILTEKHTHQGLSEKNISLLLNGKVIDYTFTDENGSYSFVISTDDVSMDLLLLQTRFDARLLQWRSSTSQILSLSYEQSLFSNLFIFISGISIFFIALIVLFFLYSRKKTFFGSTPDENLSNIRMSKRIMDMKTLQLSQNVFNDTISTSLPSKQKIIRMYHQLLSFFIDQGIEFDSSATHKDVQNQLRQLQLPRDSVDDITFSFEQAQYSTNYIHNGQVHLFSVHAQTLQTHFFKEAH